MRFLFVFLYAFNFLTAQDAKVNDIQYNVIVDISDSIYSVAYEVILKGDKKKDDRVFTTHSQDSFLIVLMDDLQNLPANKRQLLCYVHGMWGGKRSNFNDAYGMLHEKYIDRSESDIGRVISIIWPGNRMEYKINKSKAWEISEPLSETFIEMLRKIQLLDAFNKKLDTGVDLIAHSLGNELMMKVFSHVREDEYGYRLFDEIIFTAPDLDTDVLMPEGELQVLPYVGGRTHIYISTKDLTLGISSNLNKRDRFGLHGPIEGSEIPKNVYMVDVTKVRDEKNFGDLMTGHSYYRASEAASQDMLHVLMSYKVEEIQKRSVRNKKQKLFILDFDKNNKG